MRSAAELSKLLVRRTQPIHHIFIASDGTGRAAEQTLIAALTQFAAVKARFTQAEYPLARSTKSMKSEQDLYNELSYYTLAHPDPSFIHQHIVDAYTAQRADESTKPIGVAFALIGLYLYVEKNFTGKQVQWIHMRLAKKQKQWPTFTLPEQRGALTVSDVLAAPPGQGRDEMIRKWCISVWEAWKESRAQIVNLLGTELSIK